MTTQPNQFNHEGHEEHKERLCPLCSLQFIRNPGGVVGKEKH